MIDVQQNIQAVVAPSFEARFEYMSQIGIYGSYLENSVIEELFDYELGRGVSATQVLLEANAQQIPIYAITKENIDTVLPQLAVSNEVKTDIINAIHAGQHAIVPQREIQHGNWQGSGYIIQDSITGAGAYLLEGGLNGGYLEGLSCDASKNPMAALINMVIQVMELYFNIVAMISFGSFALAAVALVAFRVMVKTLLKAVVKKQVKKKQGKKGKKKKKRSECDCEPKKTRQGKRQENFCLDIFSLAFGAKNQANYLKIWRDEVGKEPKLIDNPVWEDEKTSEENDKNRLGYVSGARMKISEAKFRITQKPKNLSQTVTIIGNAKTPQGKTFVFEDQRATVYGSYVITKPMLANRHLVKKRTQFFNPMTIEWRVKYKKGGIPKTKVLGTSKHSVYVTLDKPSQELDKVYLSYLHWATSNPGATTKPEVVQKTWQHFASKNLTAWDGRKLYYYPAGGIPSQFSGSAIYCLLNQSNYGQCPNFAELFFESLNVNRVGYEIIQVAPNIGKLMLINNWTLKSVPSFPNEALYKWKFELYKCSAPSGCMTSPTGHSVQEYGDFINENGLPGQNTATPSEKDFVNHFLVKVPLPEFADKPYFDPSYGVTYQNPVDFEEKAVFGYTEEKFYDDKDGKIFYRAVKSTELKNNIGFIVFDTSD